jgi:hypothetical protein
MNPEVMVKAESPELFMSMVINWIGIETRIAAFLLIEVFRVIVVKAKYYFSKKIGSLFWVIGLLSVISVTWYSS